MPIRRSLLLALAAGGCVYAPGSYQGTLGPFIGRRVALPCVDLSIAPSDDALAQGPVVAYAFGNRCFHKTVVDLSAVRVVGYDRAHVPHAMHPFDPKRELRPLSVDAWWKGDEEVEYAADDGAASLTLCLELGGLNPEPGWPRAPRWVCMGSLEVPAADGPPGAGGAS